jgi:hypothetical protein
LRLQRLAERVYHSGGRIECHFKVALREGHQR